MNFDRSSSAGYLTNWAARLFARAVDRRLKAAGVSSGQLPVFFALGDGAVLSQKELTKAAAVEQPTMAATLARMERDGLVERRANPADRRGALFCLTPAAMDKAKAVRAAIAQVNGEATAGLSPAQHEAYLAALTSVIGALAASDGEEG